MNSILSAKQRSGSSRFRPAMEGLEDRWCPSAASIAVHNQHVLMIHTTHASDVITITDDGHGDVSATVTGGDVLTGGGSSIEGIFVIAEGGADSISYHTTGPVTVNHSLRFDFRGGHDQLSLNLTNGINTDIFNTQILNRGGSDSVAATFGNIEDTALNFASGSYAGNDQVVVNLNGNIGGFSNANFRLVGTKGNNQFVVNAPHTNVDLSANLSISLLGGSGDDQLVTNFEGVVDGNLNVTSVGFHGNDSIVTNVTADPGSNGSVIARVRDDGGGHDSLTLNVNESVTGVILTRMNGRILTQRGDIIGNTPNVGVVLG